MTSTELDVQPPQPAAVARQAITTDRSGASDISARLMDWGGSFQTVFNACEQLVQTSFVPAAFKGKPMEATAAVLTGMELGLSPMAAMQAFNPIQGQAAPKAITLRAVAQAHGHQFRTVTSTQDLCVMEGRRKGNTEWERVEWPIARAAQMQLTGKDNWKKQPGTMLVARATSELARLIAADALLGIPYSYEELADMDPVEAEVVSSTTSPHGRPLRDLAEERRPAAAAPLTIDEQKELDAALSAHGLTTKAAKLKFVSDTIGRRVTSAAELIASEAAAVKRAAAPAVADVTDAEVLDPEDYDPTTEPGWSDR